MKTMQLLLKKDLYDEKPCSWLKIKFDREKKKIVFLLKQDLYDENNTVAVKIRFV